MEQSGDTGQEREPGNAGGPAEGAEQSPPRLSATPPYLQDLRSHLDVGHGYRRIR